MKPIVPVVLAVVLAGVALAVGLRTGYATVDVDEVVFRDTLRSMRSGEGYYDAMRDALAVKEGAPPSEVRAVRPPTLFLVLRWFPESSWRWLAGIASLGILLAAWRLGEPYGTYGGTVAVALAAVWVIGASSYLFLHAELWGLPLFLAGAVAVRRGERGAAALVAGAAVVRELYALGLLFGLVRARRRAAWVVATAAVAGLAALHVGLAKGALAERGLQAPFGNEELTASSVLTFLSPGNRPLGWILGTAMLVAGVAGMARAFRHDEAARLLLPFVVVMAPAGVLATRAYWNLTWGPAVAAFVWPGIGQQHRSIRFRFSWQ